MQRSHEPNIFGDGEAVGDRALLRTWVGERISELKSLLWEVRDADRVSNSDLQVALDARRWGSIAARMARMSVEDLGRGQNVRGLSALHAHRIHTAEQVLAAGVEGLDQAKGISSQSATRWFELARNAAQTQVRDLIPAADPDRWTPADFDLVRMLQRWSVLAALLGSPHMLVIQHFLSLLKGLRRWTGVLAWLLGGESRRRATWERAAGVSAALTSGPLRDALRDVRHGLESAQRYDQMPGTEIRRQWRASSAGLTATLEGYIAQHGMAAEREVVARHGLRLDALAPGLVEAIESAVLDQQLTARNLRGYQVFGAKFALVAGKVLLGDEVGLGKTVEALAAIGHAVSVEGQAHHLVICPAQLVDNWLKEIRETLPAVTANAYRQPGRDAALRAWQQHGGILVVSYEQAASLAELDLPSLGFTVADEAHGIKNPTAQRTQAAASLAARSRRVLLMGGTLLENRAEDILHLADIADPEQGRRLRGQFGDGSTAHLQPDTFRRAIGGIYLRRNQKEVLAELPGIIPTDEPITVGLQERREHDRAIVSGNLMAARQALTIGANRNSAKIKRLGEIAEEFRADGKKLLVFSFFREVVSVAASVIGSDCPVILGGIPQPERLRILEDFDSAEGFTAITLQIEVGGHGLNLQAASAVVIMEPQYKPSTEWQAVGRAHRMGQTRPIIVRRLIAQDSTDSAIVKLSGFKAELFDQLARPSALADASPAARFPEIDSRELLREEQQRLGLFTPASNAIQPWPRRSSAATNGEPRIPPV